MYQGTRTCNVRAAHSSVWCCCWRLALPGSAVSSQLLPWGEIAEPRHTLSNLFNELHLARYEVDETRLSTGSDGCHQPAHLTSCLAKLWRAAALHNDPTGSPWRHTQSM
eukprot:CAMPEP_0182542136 /NCGR_PEP_ID=MMETSP1323-20130603/29672_1 /TAXON_ID=236787 /ORGANISM="Florenciella parvula, Strain RCC1693" /LENGTH=108 /DNA_ID=CAMNT_0024752961 /DNA_START=28 /DNA_END=351 /DNA_ORIENTATION=-